MVHLYLEGLETLQLPSLRIDLLHLAPGGGDTLGLGALHGETCLFETLDLGAHGLLAGGVVPGPCGELHLQLLEPLALGAEFLHLLLELTGPLGLDALTLGPPGPQPGHPQARVLAP